MVTALPGYTVNAAGNGVIPNSQVQAQSAVPPTSTPTVAPQPAPAATPVPAAPTIGAAYGSESASDQALDNLTGVYATAAGTPVDEAGIRANVTSQLQSEIDATNAVYAQKLNEAKIAGASNLGETAAINARRGLAGSDFGAANTANVNTQNNDVYSGIQQEQAAAVSAITDKGNALAQQEIDAKTAAKQSSASDYINYLAQQDTRKTSRTTQAATAAVQGGVDLSDPASADVKNIAASYNIDPTALVSAFVSAKNTAATAKAALAASAASTAATNKPVGVAAGDSAYQLDPTTGQYIQTAAANPTDAFLKEYQYAVSQGYTGSSEDYKALEANLKTSVGIQTNPLTGVQTQYERAGPGVAGFGSAATGTGSSASAAVSSGSTALPSASSNSSGTYTVQNGDTFDKLAASNGTTTAAIEAANPGIDPTKLQVGQKINLPSQNTQTVGTAAAQDLPNPQNKVQLNYLKNFASPTGLGGTINAQNTAVGHLALALQIGQNLANFNAIPANAGKNYFATQAGQSDVNNYNQVHQLSANELAAAYGGNAASDRELSAAIGGANSSPQQIADYAKTASQALTSKILSNITGYKTAMGQNTPINLSWFISPQNQTNLKQMGVIFKQIGNNIGAYQVQPDGSAKLIN